MLLACLLRERGGSELHWESSSLSAQEPGVVQAVEPANSYTEEHPGKWLLFLCVQSTRDGCIVLKLTESVTKQEARAEYVLKAFPSLPIPLPLFLSLFPLAALSPSLGLKNVSYIHFACHISVLGHWAFWFFRLGAAMKYFTTPSWYSFPGHRMQPLYRNWQAEDSTRAQGCLCDALFFLPT